MWLLGATFINLGPVWAALWEPFWDVFGSFFATVRKYEMCEHLHNYYLPGVSPVGDVKQAAFLFTFGIML